MALPFDGAAFLYLKSKFPHLSGQKLKAGVFTGPQIRQILNDSDFDSAVSEKEISGWHSFYRLWLPRKSSRRILR